ncbi:helix-turn-helix transcriptional regulator [Haloarcula marina]|uniref:helix-turn-helix transcriptional regulator n=1 Tax=Haloarcula marina TaxID=2961574 RepID=UPI0020B7EBC0|nr:MarR family transcriptional regulator [Halomicroarcula marina]
MHPDEDAFGDVQFLTGSPQRFSVLSTLADTPARPCELCEQVDATRTTIQRILAGFREREWVVKHDGDYRLTVTGRDVYHRYRSFVAGVEQAQTFGPIATCLGSVADELPASALENADITVSSDGNPLAALDRFTEWFRNVENDIYAVSPIVAKPFNEVGAELLQSGISIEFVIDERVLEQSEESFMGDLTHGLEHEEITMYVHDERLSFGFIVDGERCCVAGYDERNNMRAILETRGDAVVEWAMDAFERRRQRAQPLQNLYS